MLFLTVWKQSLEFFFIKKKNKKINLDKSNDLSISKIVKKFPGSLKYFFFKGGKKEKKRLIVIVETHIYENISNEQ